MVMALTQNDNFFENFQKKTPVDFHLLSFVPRLWKERFNNLILVPNEKWDARKGK